MTIRKVRVPIRADLSHLKRWEREMLPDLQAAFSVIDSIHLKQVAMMYPPGLTKAQIEIEKKNLPPKEKRLIESPTTRLAYKGHSLTGLPSVEKEDLNELESRLWRAAVDCRATDLKEFLCGWVENMRRGKFDENNRLWLELSDTPFHITIGPYEVYADKILGVKTTYEGFLGMVRAKETQELQYYQQKALEYDELLSKRYGFEPYGQKIKMVVIDEILTAGFARFEYATQAFILPNEEQFVRQCGAKQVFNYNVMWAKFESLSRKVAEVIIPQVAAEAAFNFERHFGFVSGHETGHGITIKLDGPEFAEIGSKLEEFKADVNGLLFKNHYSERTPDAEFELLTFIVDCFRRAHTNPEETHAVGNLVFLNRALKSGAMKIVGGKVHFDTVLDLWPVLNDLQDELITIGMNKDYKAGKLLLESWGKITPPIQTALDTIADLPHDIESVHEDFRGIFT